MTCSLMKDASRAGWSLQRGLQISTGQHDSVVPEKGLSVAEVRAEHCSGLLVTKRVFSFSGVWLPGCSDSRRREEVILEACLKLRDISGYH